MSGTYCCVFLIKSLRCKIDLSSALTFCAAACPRIAPPQHPTLACRAEKRNVTVIKGALPQDIAQLGGHRAPTEGNVTAGVAIHTGVSTAGGGAPKRARPEDDGGGGAELSAREKAERARREAARARVQARTAADFGLE